jgi:hypothetical protein
VSTVPEAPPKQERAPPSGAVLVWNGVVTRIGIERGQENAPNPAERVEDTKSRSSGVASPSPDAEGVRVP